MYFLCPTREMNKKVNNMKGESCSKTYEPQRRRLRSRKEMELPYPRSLNDFLRPLCLRPPLFHLLYKVQFPYVSAKIDNQRD